MGCHTWCYTHLKSEAERWNEELIGCVTKDANDALKQRSFGSLTRRQVVKWKSDARKVLSLLKDIEPCQIPFIAERNIQLFEEFDGAFGQYIVLEGKIYREMSLCPAVKADGSLCFPRGFHDMFRIHDYAAHPCYSLKDTLELCEYYHVDWNATEPSGWLINNRADIELFWTLYPDSVIMFG